MAATRQVKYGLILLMTLVVAGSLQLWWFHHSTTQVTIAFLDVGQGDAIYIHTLSNQDILIDGGPDATVVQRLGELMPFWDRTLELVVLSHPHDDHITGLMALTAYYSINQVLWADTKYPNGTYQTFQDYIKQHHIPTTQAQTGLHIKLSAHEYLSILYPFQPTTCVLKDVNDCSIVMEYHFKTEQQDKTILFTGDASSKVEAQLLQRNLVQDVDLLKVGHHGSKTASNIEFLQVAKPEEAIIQSGNDNSFGHPHEETLDKLQEVDANVLRNDQQGTIQFRL